MVQEQQLPPFLDWLVPGVVTFGSVVAAVCLLMWLIGFLISTTRRGPVEGFYAVAKVIASAVSDVANLSFRRTMAMAMLAVQESIRRRVLIAFGVFVVVMLLAGWYLDVESEDPARLYLSFVLTASSRLVLVLSLVLSAFSLPTDIKNRTIYTIVTKPVRALEIVLGRICGFSIVGTLLLMAMCLMSYIFVIRGLNHGHQMDPDTIQTVDDATAEDGGVVASGQTTLDAHHRHQVTVYADGTAETDMVMGHRHQVTRTGEGDSARYEIGPPQGALQARVPVLGFLRFLDRSGQHSERGINVGHEWGYRSYIEGGTLAAAIWTFDNVNPDRYPDGFNLELNLRVFRTYMGNIEKGILGSITIKNPNQAARIKASEPIHFNAKEFVIDTQHIARELNALNADGEPVKADLFEDLSTGGRFEVWIQCLDTGQYYGVAEADVYILDANAPFWLNFAKGYLGIWLQMLLVNTFGVMFSTFLSGPVAMLATLSTIVIGLFRNFIIELVTGLLQGGGPVEAFIRVITQKNLSVELDIGRIPEMTVHGVDSLFLWFLRMVVFALPDYESFSTVAHVAYGYNISSQLLSMHILTAIGYISVASMIGYFFLKTREVAA